MHTTSQTVALMEKDPAVKSIEYDCLQTPLATYPGAPWGLDRIDGVDDNSYNDGDLTGGGTGVRVYIVDTGVQGSHQDFGGRVVSGHTVRTHGLPPKPHTPPSFRHYHTRPSTPTQYALTAHHPFTPLAQRTLSLYPSRRLSFIPSAPRVKLSTASSLLTALGAKGTAPTWPRPSAA